MGLQGILYGALWGILYVCEYYNSYLANLTYTGIIRI